MPTSKPPKVLIVDDERLTVQEIAYCVRSLGWIAAELTSSEEALRTVDPSFDVVVLGWNMPGLDGGELLRAIRSRRELNSVAVVILTGDPEVELAVESLKNGADDYLQKPVCCGEIELKLLASISARRARLDADRPKLQVFLCHASQNKPAVRKLYARLKRDGFLPWLDEQQLVGGQDWDREIRCAVRNSDVVIVCLSPAAVGKTGYVQKEITVALDVADEQPEGRIFVIPVKLEQCEVPDRLKRWQWIDLSERRSYQNLLRALRQRATN